MTVRSVFIVSACSVLALAAVGADTPPKPGAPAKADRDDAPIVEAVIASAPVAGHVVPARPRQGCRKLSTLTGGELPRRDRAMRNC